MNDCNGALHRWSVGWSPSPRATVRLYCLPYSGTGGVIYRSWVQALAPDIDVCPIELPGRWSRLREPPFRSVDAVVAALGPVLEVDRPFGLFGCSFGGVVAFELCRWLRRQGRPLPGQLLVAATRPPSLARNTAMHRLAENEFVQQVAEIYGPLPPAIIAAPDMRQLVLGVLRADLECVETYRHRREPPLDVPITVFGGRHDRSTSADKLEGWRSESTRAVAVHIFEDGEHLFLDSHRNELLHHIRARLLGPSAVEAGREAS
ncbi:MAG: thioesterase domain-containing protein [Proteobacteria bacterium]|nr:thioesterase domain-containing protein [Pseudomonadota bacterium]